jgi:hypothetical protein
MPKKKHQPWTPVPAVDRRAPDNVIPFRARTADGVVDNPYSDTGSKQLSTVSLPDDPLGRMHARRHVGIRSLLMSCSMRPGLRHGVLVPVRDPYELCGLEGCTFVVSNHSSPVPA